MKNMFTCIVLVLTCSIAFSQEEESNYRDNFNRISKEEKRANKEKVAEIAAEKGIDLSTREGKREMADFLIESGQGNLLPPKHLRRHKRAMNRASGEAGTRSEKDCDKSQSQRQGRRGMRARPQPPQSEDSNT